MATRKSSRTSKTDHVLSLLVGAGGDREPAAPVQPAEEEAAPAPARKRKRTAKAAPETAAQTVPESAPETVPPVEAVPASRHMAPPILEVARLHNEALSETIRQALTDSLEEELARQAEQTPPTVPADTVPEVPEAAAPEEAVSESAADVPQPGEAPAPEAESSPAEPDAESAPVSVSPQAQSPAPAVPEAVPPAPAVPAEKLPGQTLPDGASYLNVMEILVEERLEKYVRLFGLCSCPRCLADVRALALSRLPAKYVVLPASAVRPMMSLYQAKFDAAVIAQVIQACKTVMESPRHEQ